MFVAPCTVRCRVVVFARSPMCWCARADGCVCCMKAWDHRRVKGGVRDARGACAWSWSLSSVIPLVSRAVLGDSAPPPPPGPSNNHAGISPIFPFSERQTDRCQPLCEARGVVRGTRRRSELSTAPSHQAGASAIDVGVGA